MSESGQLAGKVEATINGNRHGGPRANSGGKREGSGRKKGVPNKITGDLKAMILGALEGKGGMAYLMEQADANPTAFLSLIGKVLPMTVQGDPNAPFTIQIVRFGDADSSHPQ